MAADSAPVIVEPEGEIDLHSSPAVREELAPCLDQERKQIVLDLSKVTYIDSSGLAVFIETMQKIQSYGGKFILCGLTEGVAQIFKIARLDQIFTIAPDRATALTQF
ncbi:MAG: STAS domain-containing protein [Chthoniobacteraceae bacterium]